ncbi:M4 family metallopeptidase [Streptomyces sp. NPDC048172]|uniref:M4 family metallopeptidase n=1 Tax=Streptomyces sp. NPDC048172 TaxID=3365505 RepID=UPI003712A89E
MSPSTTSIRKRAAALSVAALLSAALPVPQALAGPSPASPPDPVPDRVVGEGTAAPRLVTGLSDAAPGGGAAEAARAYLAGERDRFHVAAGEKDLALLGTEGSTVRFQQTHHGVPVLGAHYLVHLRGKGERREVTGVGGAYFTGLDAPAKATVPSERSAAVARTVLRDPRQRAAAKVSDHGLVVLPRGKGRLARHHTVRAVAGGEVAVREVYVDATAGTVAFAYDGARRAETPAKATGTDVRGAKVTFDAARQDDGTYRMSDLTRDSRIDTYDAEGRDVSEFQGPIPDGMIPVPSATADYPASAGESGAVDAHRNIGRVLDFYKSRLGRDGIDGKGGPIAAVVNVTENGGPFQNAQWADKVIFGADPGEYSYAASTDVAGHEMSHGLVREVGELIPVNQTGAIEEGVVDYFGNAVDVETKGMDMDDPRAGLLGEDTCPTGTPEQCAFRDMNDGRDALHDYVGASIAEDAGGNHLNSTIFSGALWDIRERLAPATADKLVYKALTEYLTPTVDFVEARHALLAAAEAMGLPARALRTITAAFDAHGIRKGWERHISLDSTAVLPDLVGYDPRPDVRKGRYVVAQPERATFAPGIWTGSTRGGPPRRLSADDEGWHEGPSTDGTRAAWSVGDNDGTAYDVLTRRLDGGPIRSVFSSGTVLPADVAVDGRDVAFAGLDLEDGTSGVHLSRGGEPAKRIPLPAGHQARDVDLRDGTLVWTEFWKAADGYVFVPTVYDVKSGEVTGRYPPKDTTGKTSPVAGGTKTAGDRVLWTERGQEPGARTAVRAGALDGSRARDLVRADAPYAPQTAVLTANGGTVTYAAGVDDWTAGGNASLPKLFQVPLKGGGGSGSSGAVPVKVSCNRGSQAQPTAGEGAQVFWIDGTRSETDLVTRRNPVGSCD